MHLPAAAGWIFFHFFLMFFLKFVLSTSFLEGALVLSVSGRERTCTEYSWDLMLVGCGEGVCVVWSEIKNSKKSWVGCLLVYLMIFVLHMFFGVSVYF